MLSHGGAQRAVVRAFVFVWLVYFVVHWGVKTKSLNEFSNSFVSRMDPADCQVFGESVPRLDEDEASGKIE